MGIFVRSFGVGVGCPTNRYVGQMGTVSGNLRAEIENDGDVEEVVNWSLEIQDSGGSNGNASEYIYVAAGGRAYVDEQIFYNARYDEASSYTATCIGVVHTDSSSTSCTFTIYPQEAMPEILKRTIEQSNTCG